MLYSKASASSMTHRAPAAPPPAVTFAVSLANTRHAATQARHGVQQRLSDLLPARVLDDLLLIVSELVTNAVRHGHGDVALRLAFYGERIAGSVSDDGPGFAHDAHDRDPTRAGGQGLNIVSQLTTDWGTHPDTSHVWFEVSATPGH